MGGMISWKSGDGAVAKNRMQRQPQWKQPDVSVLLGHWLHHAGTPGVSTLSKQSDSDGQAILWRKRPLLLAHFYRVVRFVMYFCLKVE